MSQQQIILQELKLPRPCNGSMTKPLGTDDHFEIQDLESTISYHPHEHAIPVLPKYCELLWIRSGSGALRCERRMQKISEDMILVLTPGRSYLFQNTARLEGFRICFSKDFLADSGTVYAHISHLLEHAYNTCFLALPLEHGERPMVEEIGRMLSNEQAKTGFFKSAILKGLLKILFIQLSREANLPSAALNASSALVSRFMDLINSDSIIKRTVSAYASDLSVTRNHLNATIKKETGRSARHHIQQRMISEAKYWATYSPKSMKQIAYEMGFDDICHFSKFFKQKSGLSFSKFRSKLAPNIP
ncbi:helix-turn-helix domain-containing protein [Dyadobacter sp. CY261]|uniref:helix-turn-helix domain-containing protein n=1 Tax=Dyadobacter sp. CY261 TaxID=2907203 RepID=UPI001F3FD230|nr:helix-turn-helix domain-containing protein [Dyadobacter sp. CY261]MCF0074234.1 helix-turn-helix domain-containing protein [Dyadobacter sp. CY261]